MNLFIIKYVTQQQVLHREGNLLLSRAGFTVAGIIIDGVCGGGDDPSDNGTSGPLLRVVSMPAAALLPGENPTDRGLLGRIIRLSVSGKHRSIDGGGGQEQQRVDGGGQEPSAAAR